MTVYVYKLRGQNSGYGRWGISRSPDPWYGLIAYTDDELHAFAARLGLTRTAFEPGPPGYYVLTPFEHDQAVALGAEEITAGDADSINDSRVTEPDT